MAPFIPIRAISRSQAVRIGKQTVKTGTTTYVDLASQVESGGIKAGSTLPYSPFKELQNHLAIGAIIVVGPITASNADWVVERGFVATNVTETSEKEFELSLSEGELRQRSTGVNVSHATQTLAKVKVAKTGKEKIDRVEVKDSTGVLKYTTGAEALEGAAVEPAETTGYTTVATVTSKNEEAEKPLKTVIADTRPRP